MRTYENIILPSNGPDLWPNPGNNVLPIIPPAMRRAPGRPKKKRVRAADEPRDPHKLQRFQSTVFCGNCRRAGHNIRSCKAKTAADIVIPPGGNKVMICNN